jgi:pimeloyl-ACP methyl ester carboxylesterase
MAQRSKHPIRRELVEGLFDVGDGWHIAYQWWPASPRSNELANEKPLLFLNGLGDTYHAWTPFMPKFQSRNRLQVDLRGQGRSLDERLKATPDSSFRIPIETQSQDLKKLLDHLKLDGPVDIAAFSYGGGVAFDFAARWPERVHRLAFIVPFLIRLDRSFPMQRLLSWQWNTARSFGLIPDAVGAGVENAYESFLTAYMNQRYEHRMSNSVHRRVAIDLTYGIMKFNAFDVLDHLPDASVFLLTSDCDTLVPRSLYREFWRRLPEKKRGHWTRVSDGEHLLLEQKPEVVAEWLHTIL